MIDSVFRSVVRIYRNIKKVSGAIARVCSHELMVFRLFEIPVYLGLSFFLIAILPIFILFHASSLLLGLIPLIPLFLVAAFLSVLVHELGHAFFVRRCKFFVEQIYISALYGVCRYSHPDNIVPPVSIAWGGILAQALLCALLYGLQVLFLPTDNIGLSLVSYFQLFVDLLLIFNFFMIAINLLPIAGLDGEIIWKHVRYLWR